MRLHVPVKVTVPESAEIAGRCTFTSTSTFTWRGNPPQIALQPRYKSQSMSSSDSNTAQDQTLAAASALGTQDGRPKPFVKWAGGKGALLAELKRRMPKRYKRYVEPFVGGGAFFFSLAPQQACIADTNAELILTYQIIRDNPNALISELARHRYEREYYYQVREWDRRPDFAELPPVVRAARFILLNKTCFNGLYRVNSKGHFNVPFGSYSNPRILDRENLHLCSKALQGTEILHADYTAIEDHLQEGDLVYFDPPYAPLSATSSFTSYTSEGFDANDQVALRDLCVRLDQKGVLFMLSNSSSLWIRELYDRFTVHNVSAPRAINSKAAGRGPVNEIIVTNYKSSLVPFV